MLRSCIAVFLLVLVAALTPVRAADPAGELEVTITGLTTALEEAVRSGYLPQTTGFFFGISDGSEADDDLTFIAKAREAIAEGLTVFYSSWW